MKVLNLLQEIRLKENKTDIEELLLSYFNALVIINEILISESKQRISSESAIRKIRDVFNECRF